MPVTELQREPEELEETTLASLKAAAERHAKPSRARLGLVGDLSKIASGVRELNLGEIVLLDVEGNPVPQK